MPLLPAVVFGLPFKYIVYFVFFCIGAALISSFIKKLTREPKTLFKFVLVAFAPLMVAGFISYFILYNLFDLPLWLNLIAAMIIYFTVIGFLDGRVNVDFKDEIKR